MFYVLMALKKQPMFGIEIADFIEHRTNGRLRIGPATLYTILAKFQKEKLILETEVEGRKRTYCITEKGLLAYSAELERLYHCISDAEAEEKESENIHE